MKRCNEEVREESNQIMHKAIRESLLEGAGRHRLCFLVTVTEFEELKERLEVLEPFPIEKMHHTIFSTVGAVNTKTQWILRSGLLEAGPKFSSNLRLPFVSPRPLNYCPIIIPFFADTED